MSENDPKNTKSQQIETFLHVIDDKKLQVLKIPIGKLPSVYCMYEKNRKIWLKVSEKLLIQTRVVGGGVIFHYTSPSTTFWKNEGGVICRDIDQKW